MSSLEQCVIKAPFEYRLCVTETEYREAFEEYGLPADYWRPWMASDHANATAHWFGTDDVQLVLVCMPVPSEDSGMLPSQVYGLLIHEAVHLKQRMMELIGEDSPSKEFEAYTVQRFAQSLIHEWLERTSNAG